MKTSSYKKQMILAALFALLSLLTVFIAHQILNSRLIKSIELARELDNYSHLAQQLKDSFSSVEQQLLQIEISKERVQNLHVIDTLLKQEIQILGQLNKYLHTGVTELIQQHKSIEEVVNLNELQNTPASSIAKKRQIYLQLSQEALETLQQIQIQLRSDLVAAYTQIKNEQRQPFVIGLVLLGFLTFILVVIFWNLLRRLTVFLNNMTIVTQLAQQGYLSRRLEISAPDELGAVEAEFNAMLVAVDGFKKKLEISNKDLEEFAQMASHDLQAPLRYIQSYTQMLTTGGNTFSEIEKAKFAQNIQKSTRRLTDLIRNLLEYSKLDKDQIQFQSHSLQEIVSQIVEETSSRNPKVKIQILNGEKFLIGHRAFLQTLFQNLIENSIKYSNKQFVEIVITCIQGGETFEILFLDNGPGIPEKDREKIFDMFQRREETETVSGYGVGLAVCRKIMKMHSGTIAILPSSEGLHISIIVKKD